jgi:hypothetical protein
MPKLSIVHSPALPDLALVHWRQVAVGTMLMLVTKTWNWIFVELLELECLRLVLFCLLNHLFRIRYLSPRVKLNIIPILLLSKILSKGDFYIVIFFFFLIPPSMLVDSAPEMAISQGPTNRSRTKHIDFTMALARDDIQRGRAVMEHGPTAELIADMWTKQQLGPGPFTVFRSRFMGLLPFLRS